MEEAGVEQTGRILCCGRDFTHVYIYVVSLLQSVDGPSRFIILIVHEAEDAWGLRQ